MDQVVVDGRTNIYGTASNLTEEAIIDLHGDGRDLAYDSNDVEEQLSIELNPGLSPQQISDYHCKKYFSPSGGEMEVFIIGGSANAQNGVLLVDADVSDRSLSRHMNDATRCCHICGAILGCKY